MQSYNWANLVNILNRRNNFNFFKQNMHGRLNSLNFNDFTLEVKLDKFAIFNYDINFYKTITNTCLIRYTYYQMFRYGLFVGSSVRSSLKTSRWMTMGFRSSFVFINLLTAHAYVRSLMKIVIIAMRKRRSVLLSVNRPGSFFVGLIAHLANWCGEAYCGSRWVSGTLSNFKGVWRYFNLYLRKFKFNELTLNQQKLKVSLQGLSFLKSKPRMVFFGNYFYGYHGAKEALRTKCGPICVVDSDIFPDHVLYPLPSNDDSFSANEFYIRIIAKSALIGKLYYVMRFYKYKKMAAFNNIVLEKDLHWWDSVSRFFTKKKISMLVNQMARRKKKRYYLFKYLLKFLFLNFFDLVLDFKNTTNKIINVRRYISFFMLYSVYLRIFGDRFLMLKNFNVNFFFLFDMFKSLSKVLQASDENLLRLNSKKDYYLIVGSYFKKHFFESFLQNFFKVTPFFYFSFLVKSLANWKLRNFDINFRKSLTIKKWYYWSERILERQHSNKIIVQQWHFVKTTEIYSNFINFNRLVSLTDKILYDLNLEADNVTNYLTYDLFNVNIETFLNFIETVVLRLYGNPFYKNMYLYYLNNWETGRTAMYTRAFSGDTNLFFNYSYKKYALFIRFFKQNIFELSTQFPLYFDDLSNSKINISSGELIEFRRFFQKAFGFKRSLNLQTNIKVQPLKYVFNTVIYKPTFINKPLNTYVQNHEISKFYKEYYQNSKQFFGLLLRDKLSKIGLEGFTVLESKYGNFGGNIQNRLLISKNNTNFFYNMLGKRYSDMYLSWDLNILKLFNFFYGDFKYNKKFFLNYMRFLNERSTYLFNTNKLSVNNIYENGVTKLKLIVYFKKLFVYVYFILKNLNIFDIKLIKGSGIFNFFVKVIKKLGSFLSIFINLRKLMFKFFFINYFKAPLQKEFFFFRFFLLNSSLFSKLTFSFRDLNYKNLFMMKYSLNQHTTSNFFMFLSKIRLFKLFISRNLFSPLIRRLYLHKKMMLYYVKNTKLKLGSEKNMFFLNQNFISNFLLIRKYIMIRIILFKTKLFEFFKLGFVLSNFYRRFIDKPNKFISYFKKTNYAYLHIKFKLINFFTFLTYANLLKKRFIKRSIFFNNRSSFRTVDSFNAFFANNKSIYWLFLKINSVLLSRKNNKNFILNDNVFFKTFHYWYTLKKNKWRLAALHVKQKLYFNSLIIVHSPRLFSIKFIQALYRYFTRTNLFIIDHDKTFFIFKLVNFFFFKQSIWFFFWKLFFNALKSTYVYNKDSSLNRKLKSSWSTIKIKKLKTNSLLFLDILRFNKIAKLQNLEEWTLIRNNLLILLKKKIEFLHFIFIRGKKRIRFLKLKKTHYKLFLRKIFYFIKYLRMYKFFLLKLTYNKFSILKIRIRRLVNLKFFLYNQYKSLVKSSLFSDTIAHDFRKIFKVWYLFVIFKKRINFLRGLFVFFGKQTTTSTNLLFFFKQYKLFYFLRFFERGSYTRSYLKRVTRLFFVDLSKLSGDFKQKIINKLLSDQKVINVTHINNIESIFSYSKIKNSRKGLCFNLKFPFIKENLEVNFYFVSDKKINIFPYFYHVYINYIKYLFVLIKNRNKPIVLEKNLIFIVSKPLTKKYIQSLLREKFRDINHEQNYCIFDSKFKNLTKKKMMVYLNSLITSFYKLKEKDLPSLLKGKALKQKLLRFHYYGNIMRDNFKAHVDSILVENAELKKLIFRQYTLFNKKNFNLNLQTFVKKRFEHTLGLYTSLIKKANLNKINLIPILLKKKFNLKKLKYFFFVFKLRKKIYKSRRFYHIFKAINFKNKIKFENRTLVFKLFLNLLEIFTNIINLLKSYMILYFKIRSLQKFRFVKILKRFFKIWIFFNQILIFNISSFLFKTSFNNLRLLNLNIFNNGFNNPYIYVFKKFNLEKKLSNFFLTAFNDNIYKEYFRNVSEAREMLLKRIFVQFIKKTKSYWFFNLTLKLRIKFFSWFCKQFIKSQEDPLHIRINKKKENIKIYSLILQDFCTFNYFKHRVKKMYHNFFFQQRKKYRVLYLKKRFGFNKRRNFWRFKYFILFFKLFKNRIFNKNIVYIKEKRIWWIFWFKFFYTKLLLKKKVNQNFFSNLFKGTSNVLLSVSNNDVDNGFIFKFKNKLVLMHQLKKLIVALISNNNKDDIFFPFTENKKDKSLNNRNFKIEVLLDNFSLRKAKKYCLHKRKNSQYLKNLFFMYRKILHSMFKYLYNDKTWNIFKLISFQTNICKSPNKILWKDKIDNKLIFRILSYNIGADNLFNFGTNNLVSSYYKVRGYFNCIFNMVKLNLKKDLMFDWLNIDRFSKNFGLYFKKVYFWNSMIVPFWLRDQFFFFKNYQQIFAKMKQWIYFIISKISNLENKKYNFKKIINYLTLKYFKILKLKDYYIWYMWLLKDLSMFVKPVSFKQANMNIFGKIFRMFFLLRDRLLLSRKFSRNFKHISFRNFKPKSFLKTKRSFIRSKSFFIFRRKKLWRKFIKKYKNNYARAKRKAWFRPINKKVLWSTANLYKNLVQKKTKRNNAWWASFASKGLLLSDKKRRVGLGMYKYKQKIPTLKMFSTVRRRGRFAVRRYLRWFYRTKGKRLSRKWKNRDLPLRYVKFKYLLQARKNLFGFFVSKINKGRLSLFFNNETNDKLRVISRYFFRNKKYSENLIRSVIKMLNRKKTGYPFSFYVKIFRILTKNFVKKFKVLKKIRKKKHRFFRLNTQASFYSKNGKLSLANQDTLNIIFIYRNKYLLRKRIFMPFKRTYTIGKRRFKFIKRRSGRKFRRNFKKKFYKRLYKLFRSNIINSRFFIDRKIRWFYTYLKRAFSKFLFWDIFQKMYQHKILNLFCERINKNFSIFNVTYFNVINFKKNFIYFCYFWIKPFNIYLSKRRTKKFNNLYSFKHKRHNFFRRLHAKTFKKARRIFFFRKKYVLLKMKKLRFFYRKWQLNFCALRLKLFYIYKELNFSITKTLFKSKVFVIEKLLKSYFILKKKLFTFLLLCYILVLKYFKIPFKYICFSLKKYRSNLFNFLMMFFLNLKFLFSTNKNFKFKKYKFKRMSFLLKNKLLLKEKNLLKNLWKLKIISRKYPKEKLYKFYKKDSIKENLGFKRRKLMHLKLDLRKSLLDIFKEKYILKNLSCYFKLYLKKFCHKLLLFGLLKNLAVILTKYRFMEFKVKKNRIFNNIWNLFNYLRKLSFSTKFRSKPNMIWKKILFTLFVYTKKLGLTRIFFQFYYNFYNITRQISKYYKNQNKLINLFHINKLNYVNFINKRKIWKKNLRKIKSKEKMLTLIREKYSRRYKFTRYLHFLKWFFIKNKLFEYDMKKNFLLKLKRKRIWQNKLTDFNFIQNKQQYFLNRFSLLKNKKQKKNKFGNFRMEKYLKRRNKFLHNLYNRTKSLKSLNFSKLLFINGRFKDFKILKRKRRFSMDIFLSNIFIKKYFKNEFYMTLKKLIPIFYNLIYDIRKKLKLKNLATYSLKLFEKKYLLSFIKQAEKSKINLRSFLKEQVAYDLSWRYHLAQQEKNLNKDFDNILFQRLFINSNCKLRAFDLDVKFRENYLIWWYKYFKKKYRGMILKKIYKSVLIFPVIAKNLFIQNRKILKIKSRSDFFKIFKKLSIKRLKAKVWKNILRFKPHSIRFRLVYKNFAYNKYKLFINNNYLEARSRYLFNSREDIKPYYKKIKYKYFNTYNVMKNKYYIFQPIITKIQRILLDSLKNEKKIDLKALNYGLNIIDTSSKSLSFKFLSQRKIRDNFFINLYDNVESYKYLQENCFIMFDDIFTKNVLNIFNYNKDKIRHFLEYIWNKNIMFLKFFKYNLTENIWYNLFLCIRRVFMHSKVFLNDNFRKELFYFVVNYLISRFSKKAFLVKKDLNLFFLTNELQRYYNYMYKYFKFF